MPGRGAQVFGRAPTKKLKTFFRLLPPNTDTLNGIPSDLIPCLYKFKDAKIVKLFEYIFTTKTEGKNNSLKYRSDLSV